MPTMQISGLASGLDTESIIQELMAIERRPVTLLETRKADLDVEYNAWGDVRTRLTSLQSPLTTLKLSFTFTAKKATSSNESILTASAGTAATPGAYTVEVTSLAKAHVVASAQGATAPEGGTFAINSQEISVSAGATLANVRDAINNAEAGVTAQLIDDRLVITSNTTGTAGTISFSDDPTTNVLEDLGVLVSGSPNTVQSAADAALTINGLDVIRSTNTITDLIEGVTINLKDTTASPVTLTVASDTEAITGAVQAFVDQYNSVMDFLATKMGKTATGEPAELFGDPTAARIQQQLKQLVTDRVAGLTASYTSLADIGITTADTSATLGFSQAGKLTIDTAKLQAALEDDPDAVAALFNSNTGTTKGVAVRLASYVDSLVKYGTGVGAGVINNKQDMISEQMKDLEDQIARWEDRLALREERLWRQFTALEQALSTMQAQGIWLSSQISSLSGVQASQTSSK
ncbi:MAG: hypothetical protein D9V47_13430 [Clostridia bacterium]|nr:MAG: hypothetical protein D9V47_13430 [Clostridia bacterium]